MVRFRCVRCESGLVDVADGFDCDDCGERWTPDGNGTYRYYDPGTDDGPREGGDSDRPRAGPGERRDGGPGGRRDGHASSVDWTIVGDLCERTVLDVGVGYGDGAVPIAARSRRVVYVDADYDRVRETAAAAAVHGVDNVVPVHTSLAALPLGRDSVECALVGDALKEAAEGPGGRPLKSRRRAFLRDVHAALVDGGQLCLKVENRYNPERYLARSAARLRRLRSFLAKTDPGGVPVEPSGSAGLSRREWSATLAELGFDDVTTFYAPNDDRATPLFSGVDHLVEELDETVTVVPDAVRPLAFAALKASGRAGALSPAFVFRAAK